MFKMGRVGGLTKAETRPLGGRDLYKNVDSLVREARTKLKSLSNRKLKIRLSRIEDAGDKFTGFDGSNVRKGVIALKGVFRPYVLGRVRCFYAGFTVDNDRVQVIDTIYDEAGNAYPFSYKGGADLCRAVTKRGRQDFKAGEKVDLTANLEDRDEPTYLRREVEKSSGPVTVNEDTEGKDVVNVTTGEGKEMYVPVTNLKRLAVKKVRVKKAQIEEVKELPLEVKPKVTKFTKDVPIVEVPSGVLKSQIDTVDQIVDLQGSIKKQAQELSEKARELDPKIREAAQRIVDNNDFLDNMVYDTGDRLILIQRAYVGKITQRPVEKTVLARVLGELDIELREKILKRMQEVTNELTTLTEYIRPRIEYKVKEKKAQSLEDISVIASKYGTLVSSFEKVRGLLDSLIDKLKTGTPEVPLGEVLASSNWSDPTMHDFPKIRRMAKRKEDLFDKWDRSEVLDEEMLLK